MTTEQRKVVELAKKQVGYLEKKSNKYLDYKKKNAGFNNYTKYNRDMKKIRKAGTLTDFWCCNGVCWCFAYSLGIRRGKQVLCGCYTNYVPTMYEAFKRKKRIRKKPKFGDLVFFHNLSHIGLVVGVTKSHVYTIEFNTTVSGFSPNGGGVRKKKYVLGSSWIYCYGRPLYKKIVKKAVKKTVKKYKTTKKATAKKAVKKAYPTLRKGSKGKYVKLLQKKLGIKVDGVYGTQTEKAVKRYQKKKGLKPDGIVGQQTWKSILKK